MALFCPWERCRLYFSKNPYPNQSIKRFQQAQPQYSCRAYPVVSTNSPWYSATRQNSYPHHGFLLKLSVTRLLSRKSLLPTARPPTPHPTMRLRLEKICYERCLSELCFDNTVTQPNSRMTALSAFANTTSAYTASPVVNHKVYSTTTGKVANYFSYFLR